MAVNSGSSSLKFRLFKMPGEEVIADGQVERIGLSDSAYKITIHGKTLRRECKAPNHTAAAQIMLESLARHSGSLHALEIDGVGHRIVHGGELFDHSVLVDDQAIKQIRSLEGLAPLHNPANLAGIRACIKALPGVPQAAVFDTAFHQSMSEATYLYGLPYQFYQKYAVRKYGFHGLSHQYVTHRAAELLHQPIKQLKLISCHLGNGASVDAVQGGRSVDTSMGFTPLSGLTMGTRTGDVDPAVIPYLMNQTGLTPEELIALFNKRSGLLGITGTSNDVRDILKQQQRGSRRAGLAIDVFVDRVKKYIGAYTLKMQGVDAIIFTAGIGENCAEIRERILSGMGFMGLMLDPERNRTIKSEGFITAQNSKIKALVIPTNEEIVIARETLHLINQWKTEHQETSDRAERM